MFIKLIETFTFYGADVILLASLTNLVVYLLKISVLKKMQKKLLTFVPFAVGTVLYAAYAALKAMSFAPILSGYTDVLEHGISVGAVSTLLYVLYEQFVRDKKSGNAAEQVIEKLIAGYVAEGSAKSAASLIVAALGRDVTGDGAKRTQEIILENAAENVTEQDAAMLAKLIIETVARLSL